MSSGIDTKHGKLLAEMVVPSSSWNVQPEKQDPFKSQEAALDYLNSNNEPLYLHVPLAQSDDYVRICVTSRGDDVVFTALPTGSFLPVNVLRVFNTNTTATDILALW